MTASRMSSVFAIQSWSLTSLQQRLFSDRRTPHPYARYFTLQLAESNSPKAT